MTPRERMWAAINHQPVDRIPTDIWATGEVWEKLRRQFGSDAEVMAALHIDGIPYLWPGYVGPALPAMPEGQSTDFWGKRYQRVRYATGEYWEQTHWPLADARSIEDLEKYAWPPADWIDPAALAATAAKHRETHLVMCGYMTPFYYHNLLRGLEQSLMDPLEDPAFTHHLLNRITDTFLAHHRRCFEACPGLIDLCQVTDDLGSQAGPLISLEVFREFYKPHMQRCMDLCKEFGIRIFHHDDGAMRVFLPELVEMGVAILNPIQHACPGMEMASLKREFGDRLCFHGAIDNQQVLPFGTPEQVRAAVREAIETLACDGTGYILAPCHNIQAVSSVENIVAMYDEAWRHGKR